MRRWPAGIKGELLHFFFYGTLIAGSGNAAARAAHARLRPIGRARVQGALWAIPDPAGWYPALVRGAGNAVHGVLYATLKDFGPGDLARLDHWEDYRPDVPTDSLYVREKLPVAVSGRTGMAAQVYRFNQPLPADACAIAQGDFAAWLIATGHAACRG